MRKPWSFVPILSALLVSGSVAAQESPELSKFRWGVGGGIVASSTPYQGAKSRTFPVLVLRLQYERWFVQGIRGGYQVFSTSEWSLSAFTQPEFQALEPEDSPFLAGMSPRKASLDGGVEIVYRGRPVGFRAAALTDVLGRSHGQELSAQAITGAPLARNLLVLVGFGPRWETARRVDYYYGVRRDEATNARPAFSGEGTLGWDLSISALYRPTSHWSVFALWNRTALGDGIRQSPTVSRDSVSSFVLFVTREL